jgi:hypothetical protein
MESGQQQNVNPNQVSKGLLSTSLHFVVNQIKIAVNVIAIIIISIIVST